jgi:hypothetical protein
LWREQASSALPLVDARRLIEIKKTNREKDYAVIGELARLLDDPREQLLGSRSARYLLALAAAHPDLVMDLAAERPALTQAAAGLEALESALDAERRVLMKADERRLQRYMTAAAAWAARWRAVEAEIGDLPLSRAHATLVARAESVLPYELPEEPCGHAAR